MMRHAEDDVKSSERVVATSDLGAQEGLFGLHLSGENNEYNDPKKGTRLCVPATRKTAREHRVGARAGRPRCLRIF